ncbi:conserved hypothetical protein [Pelodictyon phaeoclathratiforme BU-1]|jgi:hypothetical protein|uniref:SpoVT-AbrB domain-containing protein n=2 Tax=Pelodictyon phaeoclathratiforme TaxID=34090 RepID=B4SB32_PELPB|nr:conserved hypothetical protein [Pelodictyon phaeoclathratiforme BU-1]
MNAMLAKLTSKNQLTLPKSIVTSIPKTDYFEVEVENGRIMLTPVRMQQADAVRAKLDALGINDQDVLDAIEWARKSQP